MVIGQAAGTAAAMACEQNVLPREVDVRELQEKLVAQGANLFSPEGEAGIADSMTQRPVLEEEVIARPSALTLGGYERTDGDF